MLALEVDQVTKSFFVRRERTRTFQDAFVSFWKRSPKAEFVALRDISFTANQGETLGVVGPNGSGKSTLLRLICGVLEPTSGRITVRGSVAPLLALGVGFHPDLTGRENAYLNGSVLGFSRPDMTKRLDRIVQFAELEPYIDVPIKHYSSGMKLRLGFSIAVTLEPDVLLIDEILAVGDASFRRKCYDRISDFQKAGVTILLVSHDSNAIRRLCTRAMVLDGGRIIALGGAKDAVDVYHALMFERQDTAAAGQAQDLGRSLAGKAGEQQRYGTGQAEILSLELLNKRGERASSVASGDRTVLRLKVLFKDRILRPLVGITIRDRFGTDIYMTNTEWKRVDLGTPGAGDVVTVDFRQNMWLGSGDYYVNALVSESSADGIVRLDWIADYLTFSVTQGQEAAGVVNLDSKVCCKTE
jgi:ABC-type polysaccharide/polyol phosphate transport system ATPase subunit